MSDRLHGKAVALGLAILLIAGCDFQSGDAPKVAQVQEANRTDLASQRVVADDGVRIAYQVSGHGDVALVFIHGWSCDASYWRAQLSEFADAYTVVAPDLAGHGASGSGRQDWSIPRFGQNVAAVVRTLPNERVILIGHSMGGYVALEAARMLPDRVVAIVGVDTLQDLGGQVVDDQQVQELLTSLREQPREATRKFASDTFFTPAADSALKQRIVEDMSSAPPEVAIPSMTALTQYDPKAVARTLGIPIIAIVSDMMPVDEAAARRVAPDFSAVTMKGVGHFLHMERPEQFNALLSSEISTVLEQQPTQ